MPPRYGLIITCSDGESHHGPPATQTDPKPDANGRIEYFVELPWGHPKHLYWLERLGKALAKKSKLPKHPDSYVLLKLPENYRLYEQVTKRPTDKKARHDLYLYGHPREPTARFRSPNEFIEHAHWLSTDATHDPTKCGCEHCPYTVKSAPPAKKAKIKNNDSGKEQPSRTTPGAPGGSLPAESSRVVQPANRSSTAIAGYPQRMNEIRGIDAQVAPMPPAPPPAIAPMPLPEPKYVDQYQDSRYDGFFFRTGELVWFRRAGDSYALGIVLHRSEEGGRHQYDMSPLSHPDDNLATVRCMSEDLVPWLAWPPPPFFNEALHTWPHPPQYEGFDWKGLKDGKYGNGSPEVDASIMAANMINSTWTPLGLINHTTTEVGAVKSYEALFSGAEKIWLGDATRLQSPSGTEVLIVHRILEEEHSCGVVAKVVGDVYRLSDASKQDLEDLRNPSLPDRLKVDLEKCNAQSMQAKGLARVWKIVENQRKVGLGHIKGRWHEASLLLPRLLPPDPNKNHLVDGIGEISFIMRSRNDPVKWRDSSIPSSLHRTETRRAAFKDAISSADELQDSLGPLLSQSGGPMLNFESLDDINQYWNFENDGHTSQ